jgi:hypothetical protein
MSNCKLSHGNRSLVRGRFNLTGNDRQALPRPLRTRFDRAHH